MRSHSFLAAAVALWTSVIVLPSSLLGKETDAEVPLAGIAASFQPDLFTGTLTGGLPIEVP